MLFKELFQEHLKTREIQTLELRKALQYDAIVIDSGLESYYAEDDQTTPYRPGPDFKSWCPENSPGSVILITEQGAELLRVTPQDFWHASPEKGDWVDLFQDSKTFPDRKTLLQSLPTTGRNLWIGPGIEHQKDDIWDWNPPQAIAHIHWNRGQKTNYEVACLKEANRIAALGHLAAKKAFEDGGSERDIHQAYLQATTALDTELPYNSIVCLNQNAATLHYQYKSTQKVPAGVLLLDAGYSVQGYGSDITRTWCSAKAPQVFQNILADLELLQKSLAEKVHVDTNFAELHLESVDGIGRILIKHDVLRNLSPEDENFRQTVRAFYPHGLGHMLGVLVHDVAGRQKNAIGEPCDPHPEDAKLRTNRILRDREVVTIEPGIYWIPMLWRDIPPQHLNIPLMEELTKWGGMRIEDNIVVGPQEANNLTRPFLPYP